MNEQSTIAPADIEADFVFCCQDDSMIYCQLSYFCNTFVAVLFRRKSRFLIWF